MFGLVSLLSMFNIFQLNYEKQSLIWNKGISKKILESNISAIFFSFYFVNTFSQYLHWMILVDLEFFFSKLQECGIIIRTKNKLKSNKYTTIYLCLKEMKCNYNRNISIKFALRIKFET